MIVESVAEGLGCGSDVLSVAVAALDDIHHIGRGAGDVGSDRKGNGGVVGAVDCGGGGHEGTGLAPASRARTVTGA